MLVHDLLRRSANRQPEALALIGPGETLTYAALDRRCNQAAHALMASGVRRGDRVAIALENGADLVAAYFGAMRAGAIAVPLPPGAQNDRFARAVDDCRPAACIADGRTLEASQRALDAVPSVFVLRPRRGAPAPGSTPTPWNAALEASPDGDPGVRVIDIDTAAIIYTSGSTGAPRGAVLSHLNITANTESIVEYLRLTPADRVMCVLPFYYVYGLSLLHTHVAVGGSVAIDNRFAFPNAVLAAMQEHKVTGFAGVPSSFALLLHRSRLPAMTFPDLRYVTQAGGGMPPAMIREWLAVGPPVPFYVMYGATEASARLTYLEPSELGRKLGSIGRAIPNVEMRVLTEDGSPARPGEIGELVARGSNISSGYWQNEEETRARFGREGYRTGDLGYADAEGFLFLVGRSQDMIKVGAHRVGAKEIEDVLHEHPSVDQAAVVGVPDRLLGEAPVAFVCFRREAAGDTDAVLAFCRIKLPRHKVPARVEALAELPQNSVGKIDKQALRARLDRAHAR
ncbi:MAG: acyl--CoA ligase [Acidobacteria bacterium]|nr:acyl--CoA ligase [Acidobacteriota bacterium]